MLAITMEQAFARQSLPRALGSCDHAVVLEPSWLVFPLLYHLHKMQNPLVLGDCVRALWSCLDAVYWELVRLWTIPTQYSLAVQTVPPTLILDMPSQYNRQSLQGTVWWVLQYQAQWMQYLTCFA